MSIVWGTITFMKIFSGTANIALAKKIAESLNIELSQLEIHVFPDQEKRIRVVDVVLEEHCVVVQPTATPADQNYMELFFIVDALKRSGAKAVTVVMPYLGYQRQDHIFRDGEAVSLEVVVKALEASGASRVIALDLHSIKIAEIFNVAISHLSALPLFARQIQKENLIKNAVLISPDMGGIRRIKILSELLGNMPYGCLVKDRDLVTGGIEIKELEIEEAGSVKNKDVIMVDDMISSGGTIVKGAELLKSKGTRNIYVFVTHPIFSQNATVILQESPVEKIFVTDSVLVTADKKFPKLEILSIASMIAEEINKNR